MNHDTKLESTLKASFKLQAQRITAMRMFTKAAIQTRSVDYKQLSLALNHDVDPDSNFKRIQRLINEVTLSPTDKHHFVMLGRKKVRIAMDRTEWDFGQLTNNLLTSGVEYNGLSIPIQVTDLGKCGSSNDEERIKALDATLEIIPVEEIEVFTADREFPSQRFLEHLELKRVSFAVRVKSNALIEHDGVEQSASEWFGAYQRKRLKGAVVYGVQVNVCGRRLKKRNGKQDYLIVVTNLEPEIGFDLYKGRWKVETLFGALKTRGFNLEDTRVTQSSRLENLVLLLGIALVWALKIGLWVKLDQGCRERRDGTPFYSLCRLGLDFLRGLFLNPNPKSSVWDIVNRVLSCT